MSIPFAMLVRLAKAIEFDSIDEIQVDIIFLHLAPVNRHAANLNVLACIARRLRSAEVLKRIRAAADKEELYRATVDDAK